MKKQFLSVFLALALCLGLCAVPAWAADTSGSCGDNVTWSYSSGTLSIQGTGRMTDFFPFMGIEIPWSNYSEQIYTVNISAGVTTIGMYAFQGCSNLTSVTIPNSVITIESGAFLDCSSLAGVTIPNSVTAIKSGVFSGCSSLTSVTIPSSVTTIEPGVFSGCGSLTSINVASGNPVYSSIDGVLFADGQTYLYAYPAGKGGLSYSIPTSVTTIGYSAFILCNNLISIIIPNSVVTIEEYAFDSCSNLTSLILPSSVTTIDGYVFDGCSSLASITIPASITSIDCAVFDFCDSLKDIYYGGSENQWKKIFNNNGDDCPLPGVTIHYNSTGPTTSPTPAPAFTDVPAWCADAVAWAKGKGITDGTTPTSFSPNVDCTHIQILTMLWRAADKPGSTATAFSGLAGDYAPAANWAYEKKMIDDSFDPNAKCTRSDAVSYIWQAFKTPEAKASSFTDVDAGAAYAPAVDWAYENGVTDGTDPGVFSPGSVCSRGQIVTFLHRAYVEEARLTTK